MKIAVITEALNIRSGSRAPINLAIALSKLKNEVTVLSLSKNSILSLKKDLENQGLKVTLFGQPKLISTFKLIRTLLALKPDVISFHATLTFLIASRLTNIPIVKTYYGTQLDAYLENVFPGKITAFDKIANYALNFIVIFVDRLQLLLADKTVAISSYCANQVKLLFGKKIDYIYLGSNLIDGGSYKNQRVGEFILSVSRFTPYKGFHKLIEACRKLPLIIVGSEEKKRYFRYLLSIKGKSHQLKINVNDSELAALYQKCVFLASFDNYPFFGMPILEAATFSKPAIALNRGAISELIMNKETGYVAQNEQEFTKLAKKLYTNTKLVKKLGAHAKAYAQNFTWEKTATSYLKIFKSINRSPNIPLGLILTILGGVFIRILFVNQHDFWFDEAFSYFIARNDLPEIIMASLSDNTPPLYYILLHFWLKLGTTPLAMRLLSLIFGTLLIPLIYYLAKKIFDTKTGIFSAQIMAFSPLFIYFSQEARMYSMLTFLTLASVYFFYIFYQESKNLRSLILFTICLSLSIYTQYIASLLLIPFNLLILNSKKPTQIKYFSCAQLAILILVFPLLLMYLKFTHPAVYSTKAYMAIPATFASFVTASTGIIALRNYFQNLLVLAIVTIAIVFFGLIFLKATLKFKDKNNQTILIFFWASILTLSAVSLVLPIFSVRSTIILAPFFYLLVANPLGESKPIFRFLALSLLIIINIALLTDSNLKGPSFLKAAEMIPQEVTIAHISILTYYPFRFYEPSKNNILVGTNPLSETTKMIIGGKNPTINSLPDTFYLVEIENGQDPKEITRINHILANNYLAKTVSYQQGLTLKLLSK